MLISEYLTRSARQYPDKVALVAGTARMTYRDLARASGSLAGYLAGQGFVRGDRVALFLDNTWEAVVGIFGVLRAGGCFVCINPATHPRRLAYTVQHCEAKFLITSAERSAVVNGLELGPAARPELLLTGDVTAVPGGTSFQRICDEGLPDPQVRMIDADLASIIYTSGSTGQPKGVTHLHRTIDTAVDSVAEYLEQSAEDVTLCLLPLSSSYGLMHLLVSVKTGGRLVLEKGLGFPFDLIKKISHEKVTGFGAAPTVFAVLSRLEGLNPQDIASLRFITNAAAPLPSSFVPRIRQTFPSARLFLMHGLTECIRTTYLPPDEIETRTGSVGKGMPNVELWIQDEQGNILPAGCVGEMVVRGSNIMAGYWNDPEATAKVLLPGRYPWERLLRTGDLFSMDQDGYFHFVSRMDDIIKSRGEKVAPVEVEDVIYMLEAVQETRVIGEADPVFGQSIRAEIVLRQDSSLTPQQVKAHCRRYLEDFKIPHVIAFVEALPKTHGGKIKR